MNDATELIREFLMDKRKLDGEVREAIRTLYIKASTMTDKERQAA
ncbi:hypothetical protein [Butyrivibrio hungatei]|uniref:Uncharacterized protein n=1 Tax=Butyrivibrio hungatei TaxID=185008 RepID=A0A1D9P5Y2_9FIRM|nr:hypothetical protein [Butyrivibrio hungatei]AOZ97902.1 hypothetical protein bhn_II103 [Butyrivibrio hungatei]